MIVTQIGIEYQKMLNEKERNLETNRANLAKEEQARNELAENARWHDMSRQTSLDTASIAAAASRYGSDRANQATRYAADMNLKRGTISGATAAGDSTAEKVANAAGFLWSTLF